MRKRLSYILCIMVLIVGSISAFSVSFADPVSDDAEQYTDEYTEGYTEEYTDPYAEEQYDDQYTEEYTEENTDEYTDQYVDIYGETITETQPTDTKDTSWFDYDDPKKSYKISTEGQLIGLASLVNEEQVDKWKPTRIENFEGVTFTLTCNIELTKAWSPIGTGDVSCFKGTFDGNGYTISGLDIDSSTGACGFFGDLGGEVVNLTVSGEIKSGADSCGGIAGYVESTGVITDCTADVTITGKDKTGGIAGYNDGGSISGCINRNDVSGTYKVGGIVGENWGGTVEQCGNHGSITSSKRGVATYGTGGVAGRSVSSDSKVYECYNYGDIFSNSEATGGVVGFVNATGASVTDCYNIGNITIQGNINSRDKDISKAYAGGVVGIAGLNTVVVKNCYNTGTITNEDDTGGVIGAYLNDDNRTDLTEVYIKNNYYLSMDFDDGIGDVDYKEDNKLREAASGISSNSMTSINSSLSSSFISGNSGYFGNGGYPVLSWQEPSDEEEEREYIEGVPADVQDTLDEYAAELSENDTYGQPVIDFFTLDTINNDALVNYNQDNEEESSAENGAEDSDDDSGTND